MPAVRLRLPVAFVCFVALLLTATVLPAHTQTFSVLHTFKGADGGGPIGVLTLDNAGDIYGTASVGGVVDTFGLCASSGVGCGTAFVLNKAGRQLGLYSFEGSNGMHPSAGLLRDATGNLYGTTYFGGDFACYEYGCGTVFKLSSTGKETVLYRFTGGNSDGFFSDALLVEDAAGNLYGTTTYGGDAVPAFGTVFKIDPQGNETILHTFAELPDGANPVKGVIRDAEDNLYGVTALGGVNGAGTVYKVDSSGVETVLYSFTGESDGDMPSSVLLADANGNLYGTTTSGGNLNCEGGSGCGVVFEVSPQPDGSWTESVLYTFCSLPNCSDGETPESGPLVRDAAGNLYGTTSVGGKGCGRAGCGVVFELAPSGKESVLYTFTGGADGFSPGAGLVIDQAGSLYGTTIAGGGPFTCSSGTGQGCGVVFKIAP
jgi:uncharacterized repeat protein (TIGR03803 family)